MKNILCASIALILFAHPLFIAPVQADFELGALYYEKGDFEKAFKEFLDEAKLGDHDAQHNLGAMYYRGEHVPQDKIMAYAWMALSTQAPNYKSEGLAERIFQKLNTAEQKSAQEKYQTLAAEYNDQAVEKRITPNFIGKSLAVKDNRIIKSVAPVFPKSMLTQGVSGTVDITYTIDKNGFTRDHVVTYSPSTSFTIASIEALRRYEYEPTIVNGKSVDVNGFRLRMNYRVGNINFSKTKIAKAVDEMREKARTGGKDEKMGFAYFLETIPSFRSDYELVDNPNEWYINAANQGSGAASFFLGRNILYGKMCQQDSTQSMAWLLKAAKQGVSDAQYMLALESFSGVQFEKNEEKGFYWLEKAAANSDAAKIRYAWVLATHPKEELRNGKKALTYLEGFDSDYLDKQSLYQAQAAVAAENGDFKKAVEWQEKALDDAGNIKLPTTIIEQRLARYTNKTAWREDI